MADWNGVKDFLKENYKVQKDGDFLTLIFGFDNGRKQIVVVTSDKTKSGEEWVQIASPVGEIGVNNLNSALELMNKQICGGLVKIGSNHYVRHCMPIADVSSEEIDSPLRVVCGVADLLEQKFVGGDEN